MPEKFRFIGKVADYGRNAAKWAKIAADVPTNWPEAKAKDPVFKGETEK